MQNNTDFSILFEDEDILVIDKPPGVVVNDAHTTPEETVQSWHRRRLSESERVSIEGPSWQTLLPDDFDGEYGSPEEIFTERNGIVHRLDKDTSGVLILAKNPGSLVNLLTQFKQRQVEKTYICLVHGFFAAKMDILRFALDRHARDRFKFAVSSEGKMAETQYQVKAEYAAISRDAIQQFLLDKPEIDSKQFLRQIPNLYQGFSLLECTPKTGRTHQIRVHLAHVQHPLVGDATYVGKKRTKLDAIWCPRQFLHASQLQFTHPRTKKSMTVQSELTADLIQVLELLIPRE